MSPCPGCPRVLGGSLSHPNISCVCPPPPLQQGQGPGVWRRAGHRLPKRDRCHQLRRAADGRVLHPPRGQVRGDTERGHEGWPWRPPRVGVPLPRPLRARRTARADNPGTALTFALPEEEDGLARIEDALAGGRGDPLSLWGGGGGRQWVPRDIGGVRGVGSEGGGDPTCPRVSLENGESMLQPYKFSTEEIEALRYRCRVGGRRAAPGGCRWQRLGCQALTPPVPPPRRTPCAPSPSRR